MNGINCEITAASKFLLHAHELPSQIKDFQRTSALNISFFLG